MEHGVKFEIYILKTILRGTRSPHTHRIWSFHCDIVVLHYRGYQRYHVLRIITHM